MQSMFYESVDQFLNRLRHSYTEPIKTSNLQLVSSLCNLMDCMMKPSYGFKENQPFDK